MRDLEFLMNANKEIKYKLLDLKEKEKEKLIKLISKVIKRHMIKIN